MGHPLTPPPGSNHGALTHVISPRTFDMLVILTSQINGFVSVTNSSAKISNLWPAYSKEVTVNDEMADP